MPPQLSPADSGLAYSKAETLVVFRLSDRLAALRAESVERIVLRPELAQPPGLPLVLEGILNLAGSAIPVLRLDRLMKLPDQNAGLYSMLLILRSGFAILVEQVSQIVTVPGDGFLPIAGSDCFNACATASARVDGEIVPLLSPEQILLEKEKQVLMEFRESAQLRIDQWEGRA